MVSANLVYLNNKTVLFPIEVKCRVSFIYAEKYRDENVGVESVRILCDTKIIPDEYTSMQFSKVQCDCVSKYGIVKSTICNPQLCISYAGNNILFAARLFSKLWDMKSFENDEVSAIALDVHNEAAALHSTDNIILFTSASDGGYSYEVVHQDIQNVFFVIDQMKPAILYSRQFRVSEKDLQNPNLFGLMLPLLTEFKEDGSVARYR